MGEALGGHGKLRKRYTWFCFCHTDLVIKRLQVEMQSRNASRNAVEKVALYCPHRKGKRKVRNGALADRYSGTAEPCPAVSVSSQLSRVDASPRMLWLSLLWMFEASYKLSRSWVCPKRKRNKEPFHFTATNFVILPSIHLMLQDKSVLLTSALAYSYMLFHLIHNQSTYPPIAGMKKQKLYLT